MLRPALIRGERRERATLVALAVSAALHALVLFAVLSKAAPSADAPGPDLAIQVETASPQQFDAIIHPPPPPPPLSPPPVLETPAARSPTPSGAAPPQRAPGPRPWRRAGQLLSAAALDEPRNRSIAPKLAHVEPKTAREQICDLEAILQIGRIETDFVPDAVVAYAMADIRFSGDLIVAAGAAFRSRGRWYNLKFKCRISERPQRVLAFEFAVGDAVPREDWSAHALAAGSFQTGEE